MSRPPPCWSSMLIPVPIMAVIRTAMFPPPTISCILAALLSLEALASNARWLDLQWRLSTSYLGISLFDELGHAPCSVSRQSGIPLSHEAYSVRQSLCSEQVQRGTFRVSYLSTDDQLADVLTKSYIVHVATSLRVVQLTGLLTGQVRWKVYRLVSTLPRIVLYFC
ncbi:hypothetical protein V2J09_009182 [Rumex salicifolius]